MTTTNATDTLLALAPERAPGLREALTQDCIRHWRNYTSRLCVLCGQPANAPPGRVLLSSAEAHVALEKWCKRNGWYIEMYPESLKVAPPSESEFLMWFREDTLEAAVLAALLEAK